MIELVLTVCLLTSPTSCRDEWPEFAGQSLIACITQAQIQAAAWAERHPAYRIAKWRCQSSRTRQLPI